MRLFVLTPLLILFLASCGGDPRADAPTRNTPTGAKVDLTGVSLVTSEPTIVLAGDGKIQLRFDYTLNNTSGMIIVFPCIYASMDQLIEVNLTDKKGKPILLGRRTLEGLTLAQPRPMRIPAGKTTHSYSVPIAQAGLKKGDPVNIRIRLHTPSRYDELRTSLEAARAQIPWP